MDAMIGTLEFVAATDWVAVLPSLICVNDIGRSDVVVNPIVDPPHYAEFVVIEPARHTLTVQAQLFLESLQREVARIQSDVGPSNPRVGTGVMRHASAKVGCASSGSSGSRGSRARPIAESSARRSPGRIPGDPDKAARGAAGGLRCGSAPAGRVAVALRRDLALRSGPRVVQPRGGRRHRHGCKAEQPRPRTHATCPRPPDKPPICRASRPNQARIGYPVDRRCRCSIAAPVRARRLRALSLPMAERR